ncbi:MAG TPA: Rpn family recombination-promoting nuclease/putative transposase [Gemmataceae bacterium]|nr:Rpn family recombination-promoting nuclease/putative transposase [Gemmataceae bacterium]
MSFFTDPPLHDFPDRAIRRLQAHPEHLRQLVSQVAPELAGRFAFERTRPLEREFPLPDWRRRESDLLFHVPFREAGGEAEALVCVLVEHQSAPDPSMPLRTLLYAVLYWERQWRAWEERRRRGEPLRLGPVLPIVLHTGPDPWAANRTVADLIDAPEGLRQHVPAWQPLFWDLAQQTPEALLGAAGEWLQALAVVRAERAGRDEFWPVFEEALRRLAPLSERDKLRWQDLMWFLLSWAVRRRPGGERHELFATVVSHVENATVQEEIQTMSQQVMQDWEQEAFARGEARGAFRNAREILRDVLSERFGELPEALVQRIEAVEDLARLRAAIRQAVHIQSLDELQL